MRICDLTSKLEDIAPPELADGDDKIGLQVGDATKEVRKLCVSVDSSPHIVQLALAAGADILVSHHPLIFRPLARLSPNDPVARCVVELIRSDAAIYVMHTNYDSAPGGINDVLAEKLGVITHGAPLFVTDKDHFFKIVVFVPEEAVEAVRNAMADAGAGMIGQYTHCSFRTQGTGSFVPLSAARPYIGTAGKLEEVEEYRLEMICSGSWVDSVVSAMLEKHPYDEVAYDLYQLANEPTLYGYGRVGVLSEQMSLSAFSDRVKSALELDYIKVAGDTSAPVKTVAVCGGSGSSLYRQALEAGADVYVTGDTKHHDILDANALGLAMIDAGHLGTERPGMMALAAKLRKVLADSKIEVEYIE